MGAERGSTWRRGRRGSRPERPFVIKDRRRAATLPQRTAAFPMLRRLYDWTLSLASRPAAPYALGAVSFAESLFLPMPLARPDRVWSYALIMTVTSVLGGIFGYAIGALLYDSVGQWLFRIYGLTEGAEAFRAGYAKYGH